MLIQLKNKDTLIVDEFKFKYIFKSSTDMYQKGIFNNTLFLYFNRGFGILRVKFSILDPKPAHKIINVKFFIYYKYFS